MVLVELHKFSSIEMIQQVSRTKWSNVEVVSRIIWPKYSIWGSSKHIQFREFISRNHSPALTVAKSLYFRWETEFCTLWLQMQHSPMILQLTCNFLIGKLAKNRNNLPSRLLTWSILLTWQICNYKLPSYFVWLCT